MKLKMYTKRSVSLLLCVVMFLSCWVFAAPAANAVDATAGTYSVSIKIDCSNGFTEGNGGCQGLDKLFWRVYYLENNGTGTTEKYFIIDFTDTGNTNINLSFPGEGNTVKGSFAIFSGNDPDETTVTITGIPGFPTGFYCFVNNRTWFNWYTRTDQVAYSIKELKICDTIVWQGDLYNQTDHNWRSGSIRYSSISTRTDVNAIAQAQSYDSGSSTYYCKTNEAFMDTDTSQIEIDLTDPYNDADGITPNKDKKYTHYTNTFKGWADKFPCPQLADYSFSKSNYTAGVDAYATLSTTSYTLPSVDQYGVQLAGTFTADFSLTDKKTSNDSSTWTTSSDTRQTFSSPADSGNFSLIPPSSANNIRYYQYTVQPTVYWTIGNSYINVNGAVNGEYYGAEKSFVYEYEPQTVTYNYNTTTTLATPVETDTENHIYDSMGTTGTATAGTASALYGDTITAAAPTGNYNYYDASGHYAGTTFTVPTAEMTADVNVGCDYSAPTAHEWGAWQNFTGETEGMAAAAYHRSVCTAVAGEPHYRYQPHNWVRTTGEKIATGQALNHVVYQCADCELFAAASYDPIQGYSVDTTHTGTAVSDVQADSATIATPVFNVKEDTSIYYQYALRLASLRVKQEEIASTTQALRFSGNINVQNLTDKGVSLHVNPAQVVSGGKIKSLESIQNDAAIQDTIVDFGFIFTQARMINTQEGLDLDALTLEGTQAQNPSVFKMSVVENNAAKPAFDNNWEGATLENQDLTFNLVVAISRNNWKATYVARTYVVYKYHGDMFVLYDSPETVQGAVRYSHDSVYNQTQKNLALSNIPQSVKDYLNTKIVSYCDSGSFSGYSDWNTAYLPKG